MGGAGEGRVFLFLQGPHGPFYPRLARALSVQGAEVRRIAFNRSDEVEWAGAGPLQRYCGQVGVGAGDITGAYPRWLAQYLRQHQVTDIILYGDSRPEHAQTIEVARPLGIVCHCLEEGYLRPHHITYERWGSNGNSRIHRVTRAEIARAVGPVSAPEGEAPDGWGAHRAHLWHSARYHARLALPSRHFPPQDRRRGLGLWQEFGLYARRLAGLPLRRLLQGWRVRRLLKGGHGRRYYLVLLQLSFDSSMRAYSGYDSSASFVADCVRAFAQGAPQDAVLLFKSHPFEDGREGLHQAIRQSAKDAGISGRVIFVDGGPTLRATLGGAAGVVTINSTAGQQALWHGLPVAVLGRAVYARPGLVSQKPLAQFFAAPDPVDRAAYWQFRAFLTRSSQLRGSFYSRGGIDQALQCLPEAILDRRDPYERLLAPVRPAEEGPGRQKPSHPQPMRASSAEPEKIAV